MASTRLVERSTGGVIQHTAQGVCPRDCRGDNMNMRLNHREFDTLHYSEAGARGRNRATRKMKKSEMHTPPDKAPTDHELRATAVAHLSCTRYSSSLQNMFR